MTVRVVLPMSLRQYADGKSTIDVDGATITAALGNLTQQYSDLQPFIVDDSGRPLGYLNLFVNEKSVVANDSDEVTLNDGDELLVVSAIAGG